MGRIYSTAMGGNLKKVFAMHNEQTSKNPRLDFQEIEAVKYIHEFDRAVQGPLWGYPTEGAYYRDASSIDSLLAVRIPIFAINAKDDPVMLPY
jgi:predicted alpha/beta-fold hydrolase